MSEVGTVARVCELGDDVIDCGKRARDMPDAMTEQSFFAHADEQVWVQREDVIETRAGEIALVDEEASALLEQNAEVWVAT